MFEKYPTMKVMYIMESGATLTRASTNSGHLTRPSRGRPLVGLFKTTRRDLCDESQSVFTFRNRRVLEYSL